MMDNDSDDTVNISMNYGIPIGNLHVNACNAEQQDQAQDQQLPYHTLNALQTLCVYMGN
jgi:hypothetical protein